MSAGRRNRLITIQRPVVTVSNTGSTTQAWETFVSLWAEMKDRTSTGVENEHASTTLSIRRADWVIRQTVGITPAMRIIYDNTVWDILAINSLSYDRNKMLLVTEQRASLTAEDVATCPTLCERIDAADAQDIVDCLSAEQETAVKALICPASQEATFTLNSVEVGTAEGGETLNVQVLQGGVVVGSLVGADWVIPPCPTPEPATYTNGAAFTQEIAAGKTFTAPQVTMTAVDGTTEDIPANEDYTCKWKVLTLVSTTGKLSPSIEITSYPPDGNVLIQDTVIESGDGSQNTLAYRPAVRILNANISQAVNDSPQLNTHNLTIEVNVPVVNSNGDSVGPNVTSLLTPAEVDDLLVTDSDGAVGTYPMPTALAVIGQVNSATYSAGTLTITPAGGGSSERIYQRSTFRGVPATQYDLYDLRWQILNGTYNYGTPHGQRVALDFSAAHPFFTLVDNNAFGNKSRFTDSEGNAPPDGLAGFSTIDWAVDRPTAIANYAIDHLTGLGWCLVKVAIAEAHGDALATAHAHTMGGLSGFRVPSTGEAEDVLNTAITVQFFGTGNIFYRNNTYASGNETAMWLNSTHINNPSQANTLNDSGDITRTLKLSTSLRATYAVRTHYPAP